MRIYLDNAATSWPKPEAVYAAVDDYQRNIGVSPGRAATNIGGRLQSKITQARSRAARLLGAATPSQVLFAFNGTDALNMAIHGLLQPHDHVVTSTLEHNSVLRPLQELQRRIGVEVTVVSPAADGVVTPDQIREAMRPQTRLVALTHASNVTGMIQPVADVADVVHTKGDAVFLVDAAQTAGHTPVDVEQMQIDLLACSGHKGLLGPLGVGLLVARGDLAERIASFRQGGTGTLSEDDHQPDLLPDKFEAGSHNSPGLVGLGAALEWIESQGIDKLHQHQQFLVGKLLDRLQQIPSVSLYGPLDPTARAGVVSFNLDGFDSQELAAILDDQFGIEIRAGLHCAPGAHRELGTLQLGGAVRISPGAFNTEADIDAAIRAVSEIAGTGSSA